MRTFYVLDEALCQLNCKYFEIVMDVLTQRDE
jgi:hypothetical protein